MKPKKLIRAKMTELFTNNEIETVEDKNELNKLYSLKIQEELQEIQNSNYKDIAEFGDLISVAMSFAVVNGFEPQEILQQIKNKDAAKGLYYNIASTNLNPSNPSNNIYFKKATEDDDILNGKFIRNESGNTEFQKTTNDGK